MTDPESEGPVRIRALAAGGSGVGELPDGRVCFVPRTAPGDLVRVRIVRDRPRWAAAEATELLDAGPDRRPAPCPYFDRCGGCALQHIRYEVQLQAKADIVRDALERIGGVPHPEVSPPDPAPSEYGYRSRVTFHLMRRRSKRIVAGFRELGRPSRIVDIDGRCLLPEGPLARIWDELRQGWGPGADRLPSGARLRLTLRAVSDGAVLVVEPEPVRAERGRHAVSHTMGAPEEVLARVDGLRAIWWRHDDRPELIAGDPDTEEEHGERRIRTGPGAFVQVNRAGAEGLRRAVETALGTVRGRRVVDAYCGVGESGRHVALQGGEAIGIEVDSLAVEAARVDAPEGFRVLHGTVEERLEEALPADVLVFNPPRGGLDEALPARIAGSGVERILYVSCDPATLARDIDRIGDRYHVRSVEAFDLFPQTAHVEVLTVLDLCPGDGCGTCATS